MLASIRRIMRRFYGPRHLMVVAASILAFPAIVLWLHNLRAGWRKWYRLWLAGVYRSGGWLLLRKWVAAFRKDGFLAKLAEAKRALRRQARARILHPVSDRHWQSAPPAWRGDCGAAAGNHRPPSSADDSSTGLCPALQCQLTPC